MNDSGSNAPQNDAFKASVSMSYRLWRDGPRSPGGYKATPSFPKAVEWLDDAVREGCRPSLEVLFRWRTGGKEGDGSVSYIAELYPPGPPRFVRAEVNKLIAQAIAWALAEGRFLEVRPETASGKRIARTGRR